MVRIRFKVADGTVVATRSRRESFEVAGKAGEVGK